jgi:hypothetical protein
VIFLIKKTKKKKPDIAREYINGFPGPATVVMGE